MQSALGMAQNVLSWCTYSAAPRLWHWLCGDEAQESSKQLPQPLSLQQMQSFTERFNDIKTQQDLVNQWPKKLIEDVGCILKCRCTHRSESDGEPTPRSPQECHDEIQSTQTGNE